MYNRKYKSDFSANWICAPDSYLEKFNRSKTAEFSNAKFIWGRRYTRTYFRRIFSVKDAVKNAFLHFLCDNICDVYLNGKLVSSELKDSGRVDIKDVLVFGENLLMIRAYQTASPESFTSALTGGLRVEYTDGSFEEILTDESFENVRFIDFWQTEDPEGWELDKTTNKEVRSQLIVTDMHAIAIKRSCYFRKEIFVERNLRKAILRASALGTYEPHINGEIIDNSYFRPSSMDRAKEYQEYDVTEHLNEGKNVLAAILGNGWYNCESWGALLAKKPAILMELTIEYGDGSVETVGTDESWMIHASPLEDNDIQFGERYCATLEIDGWDMVECDENSWEKASLLDPPPFTSLLLQEYPPIRTTGYLSVTFVRELPDGSRLFDCGLNIAGAVELTVRNANRGQKIYISVSERLGADGYPELGAYVAPYYMQDSYPDGKAPFNLRNLNVYTAAGRKNELYSPKFCYTGFRYIRVLGIKADEADIAVRVMHNDLVITGDFKTDDKTLMRLWEATKQTWLNNCYNGPTDCPTREKNFWTGDTMIFSHFACWYTDCEAFLSRWTDLGRKMSGPYGWEDEEYMLPWTLYKFYGDKEILKTKYKSICGLVEHREKTCNGTLLPVNPYSCYNDWLNPTGENLSSDFFSHCWYLRMLDIVSKIADVVGDVENKQKWQENFKAGKTYFNQLYYNPEKGEYSEKIQSSAVLPLAFGLVPSGEEYKIAATLHSYLQLNGYRLTTGFQASRYMLDVLTDYGYGEDAIKLLHQSEFPSWKYILDSGATNITESWLAMNDPDKSISMCHFSLGSSFAWFFEYLGGVRIYECAPGFERVVLEPHCFEKLGACRISYSTKYGEIISDWHFENGKLIWDYSVPEEIESEVRQPRIYRVTDK